MVPHSVGPVYSTRNLEVGAHLAVKENYNQIGASRLCFAPRQRYILVEIAV